MSGQFAGIGKDSRNGKNVICRFCELQFLIKREERLGIGKPVEVIGRIIKVADERKKKIGLSNIQTK